MKMKRVLTLIMLSAVILTQTEVYQLFKLAALADHFSEHERRNPEISIGEFLVEHYLQCEHNDSDRKSDEELPFKNSQSGLNTAPAVIAYHSTEYNFFLPSGSTESIAAASAGKTSAALQDIWQPPRFI
jgi:hypothetical protein